MPFKGRAYLCRFKLSIIRITFVLTIMIDEDDCARLWLPAVSFICHKSNSTILCIKITKKKGENDINLEKSWQYLPSNLLNGRHVHKFKLNVQFAGRWCCQMERWNWYVLLFLKHDNDGATSGYYSFYTEYKSCTHVDLYLIV